MAEPNSRKLKMTSFDVVFSFDTTGSMYKWLDGLRNKLQEMIQRLKKDIPSIKISVVAHGDYCDASVYVTKWVDFTSDVDELCKFVMNVEKTDGGDAPECYELVLREAHSKPSWTPGSRRALVMIGDSKPHEPNEECNTEKINWRWELEKLAHIGVTIYAVQCGNNSDAAAFYQTISETTLGKHLHLEDFGNLLDTLLAVCYRESNRAKLAELEKEVRGRFGDKGPVPELAAMFEVLKADDGSDEDFL